MNGRFIKKDVNQIDTYIETCRTGLSIPRWWTTFKELLLKLEIFSMESVFEHARIRDAYIESSGLIFIFNQSLHNPWSQLTQETADQLLKFRIERNQQGIKVIITNGLAFHVYTIKHLESEYLKDMEASDGLNLDSKLASIRGYKPLLEEFIDRTINI
ncbi:MAG: hypothetical protein CL891_02460 [Dehalococcoidia bacterium]|nr:hypothetical protein [Dehalococcoidia bacterium]